MLERAREAGIELRIETDVFPSYLIGDATRLRQAVLNFATNAVKFTERGTVTLRAFRQEEREDWVRVRFEVADTGIGIPPDALARLFQAFEQADNSTTRKYGGTGLGLAITRRLAELMGGAAGADSEEGVGSTFWFTCLLRKGLNR
jgi:two-component system sensor histidine kinase/response regulator